MIAIDVTPLCLGGPGGGATALRALLQGIERLDPREREEPVKLLAPRLPPPGVPLLDGVVLPRRPVGSARALRRVADRLLAEAGATVLLSPWLAFPRTALPVVVTVHELPFVRWGPIEGRLRTFVHRRWLARALARAAAVLVPSFAVRDDLLRLSACSGGLVHVVAHGFDPAPWEAAAAAAGRAAAPASGTGSARGPAGPDVVAVGTGPRGWGPRKKGLDVLLAALERLAPRRLDVALVGGASPGRLPEGARLLGGVGDEALRRLVACARLLVHPARSEGFGFPPLEAMAAGVPVVASRAGSIPEIAGDAALLVEPGDPDALAAAILRALGEPELRARLVAAGRQRARAFPPEQAARRTLALLTHARDRAGAVSGANA